MTISTKKKSLTTYFSEGYALAIKKPFAYVLGYVVPFIFQLLVLQTSLLQSWIAVMMILIINIGIAFTFPILLDTKLSAYSNVAWSFTVMTLKSIKRLFLPGLFLFILLGIFLMVISNFFGIQSIEQMMRYKIAMFAIPMLLFSFNKFYFALDNSGLLKSFWRSTVLSIRNISFSTIMLPIRLIPLFFVDSLSSKELSLMTLSYLGTSVLAYWENCVTYLYFRSVVKR